MVGCAHVAAIVLIIYASLLPPHYAKLPALQQPTARAEARDASLVSWWAFDTGPPSAKGSLVPSSLASAKPANVFPPELWISSILQLKLIIYFANYNKEGEKYY